MGSFISYMIQVSLVMTLLFACYKVLLSSATFHTFKRFMVLGIVLVSWVLPFAVPQPLPVSPSADGGVASGMELSGAARGRVEVGMPVAVAGQLEAEPVSSGADAWKWLAPVYACGLACVLVFTLLSVCRLISLIRGGDRRRWPGFVMVLNPRVAGPFSWGRYVVMRPQDCDDDFPLVMTHELSHMRRLHWIDIIIAQVNVIVLWFNPLSYVVLKELKSIHEYEADRSISSDQIRRYQLMLIRKTVGSSFPTFANSLNHSQIKTRITMMMKKESKSSRRLSALALPGAATMAVLILSQPSVAQILADVSASWQEPETACKVSDKSGYRQIADVAKASPVASASPVPAISVSQDADKESELKTVVMVGMGDCTTTDVPAGSGPAVFVDGKPFGGSLSDIDPSEIKAMSILKDDPQYPQGKLMIEKKSADDRDVFYTAEVCAMYQGGQKALMAFMADNLKYPADLKQPVRVVVQFTVGKDGSVSDMKVLRSGGEQADAEAVRVLSMTSGKWISGTMNGEPVATRFVLPVQFQPE